MKLTYCLAILFMTLTTNSFAQQASSWEKWAWLLGQWKGDGSGQPGQGTGTFSFSPGLDEKILIRKDHSQYPATEKSPAVIHDGLLIVYADSSGNLSKGIYFDNEGHTINYSINFKEKEIVLLSEKVRGVTVFRLTYSFLDKDTVYTRFEISPDGEKFMTYVQGKSTRVR